MFMFSEILLRHNNTIEILALLTYVTNIKFNNFIQFTMLDY